MSEKRSSRVRKVPNYALLVDSDNEFFEDDEPIKLKKNNDKEAKSISKPAKIKKIAGDAPMKQCETIQIQKEKSPERINNAAKQTTCPSVPRCETSASITVSSPKTMSKSVPSTPVHSNPLVSNVTTPPPSSKASFPITPSTGLRLGLSRTKRLRSLHANVRIA
ncbi:unnamed protein product [Schistosoma turkestanicum]|nr:unnamed protein product [Schistosoma turkestanicum]